VTDLSSERHYLEDWERDARQRPLSPDAYTRPVMALFNKCSDVRRKMILDKFSALGAPGGLCKHATPEQRKAFMLWAEKQWPEVPMTVPEWPQPSLAAKFHASQQEAVRQEAARHPQRAALAPTTEAFDRPPPVVALAITCFCGKSQHLRAATGQYRCQCGATWTVHELRISAQPASVQTFTFGADPEGEGLQPYEGSTARNARTVVRSARPVGPFLPPPSARPAFNASRRGEILSDEEEVGLPPDFTGLGGMRVGPIGVFQREPYDQNTAGDDEGDTVDLGDL
jgi:hypothetical protein